MANDVSLDASTDRISAASTAGEDYTTSLETIRDNLDNKDDNSGSSLGQLMEGQLEMTEAEASYQVEGGIPTKSSKSVLDASKGVKSA